MRTITTTDYDNIVATVRLYVDGWNERDVEKYKSAFHPDAWMSTQVMTASFTKCLLRKSCSGRGPPGPPATEKDNVKLRILSVAQMGGRGGGLLGLRRRMAGLPFAGGGRRRLEDHKQDGLPPEQGLNSRLAQSQLRR